MEICLGDDDAIARGGSSETSREIWQRDSGPELRGICTDNSGDSSGVSIHEKKINQVMTHQVLNEN